ncbi:MAG: hemin-degrading factor [Planctomycetaceae bacterium]|nr:hemin-degrading factor [Planctomycetaceae bacterium]
MQTPTTTPSDPDLLLQAQDRLVHEHGGRLFPSDAAKALGISEAELLAARVTQGATRLELDLKVLLADLAELGPVKAITRNRDAVLEVVGPWRGLDLGPHHGLVIGGPIDLRIFPRQFAFAFAVDVEARGRRSRSVQFYGPTGEAVHKLFLVEGSDGDNFERFVGKHRSAEQARTIAVRPSAPAAPALAPPLDFDVAAFEAGWRAMTDPHQYHGLLARHGVTRRAAVDLVPRDLSRRLNPSGLADALKAARLLDVPLMVFVGNPGCIQIHTGRLDRIVSSGGWLNVLDPEVDLHVRESAIDAVYAVRKPAESGRIVSSLEVFASDGELLLTLFGKRKPGEDELPEWREIHRALFSRDGGRGETTP